MRPTTANATSATSVPLRISETMSPSVFDSALAEAGRLARTHGYQYFVVLKLDDRSVTTTRYMPGEAIPFDLTGHVSRNPAVTPILSPANMAGGTLAGPGKALT